MAKKKTKRVGKLETSCHGDLLMVEYIDGVPHNVVTSKSGYDFEVSKRWGLLCHDHGGGGCYVSSFIGAGPDKSPIADLWIADGEGVTDAGTGAALSPEELRAMGYRVIQAPLGDPFEDAIECGGGIEWCVVCDDCMPDDSENLCGHLTWIDDVGITGPGNSDAAEDGFSDFMLPVIELACRAGIVRAWRKHLAAGADSAVRITSAIGGLGPEYVRARIGGREVGDLVKRAAEVMDRRGDNDARVAARWFVGLDEETTAANKATIEWLDLVIACQNERRASGLRCYALRPKGYYYGDEQPREKALYPWAEARRIAGYFRAGGVGVGLVYVRPRAKRKRGKAR